MSEPLKPKFAYTPWRVEKSPGEILVVDSRDLIVVAFSADPEDLENISLVQLEVRAYGFAALPEIREKAASFLEALVDPVKSLDEGILLACAGHLAIAMRAAEVPPPAVKKEPKNERKPLG